MIINDCNDCFSWKTNIKHIRYTRTIVTTLTEKNNIAGEGKFYQISWLHISLYRKDMIISCSRLALPFGEIRKKIIIKLDLLSSLCEHIICCYINKITITTIIVIKIIVIAITETQISNK